MDTEKLLWAIPVGIGSVAVLAGGVVLIEPSVVGGLPFNQIFVLLTSGLAFGFGALVVRQRYRSDVDRIPVSETDQRLATSIPGDEIDDIISEITTGATAGVESRNQIRERIGEVAADLIVYREKCSREEAIQQLTDGTWTDNGTAAGFFSQSSVSESESMLDRVLRSVLGRDSHPYREQIGTVIDALAVQANVSFETESEESGSVLDRFRPASDDRSPASSEEVASFPVDEGELVAEGIRYRSETKTNLWKGVTAFAFVAAAVGILTFQPAPVLASTVAVAFGAVSRASTYPPLTGLTVERELETETAEPGEEVQVTVTVENEGNTFRPDVRIVDRVPGTFEVVEGSSRMATALRPGETATMTYVVTTERGEYTWPTQIVGRDVMGTSEREAVYEVEGELTVSPRLRTMTDMPVRSKTSLYSGQIDTKIGGSGLEFFSVREYTRGDPLSRIDWKQVARGKDLATIDYREERAAKIVLLFDTRDKAYVSSRPERPHAVNRAISAGAEIFTSLHESGNLVGLAAFDTIYCWVKPNAGDEHLERARRTFTSHKALSPLPPEFSRSDEQQYIDPMTHLRRQFPTSAQIVLFSPLTFDDYAAEIARRLDSAGHPVTLISPDPTATRTPGQRLAHIERILRIAHLRETGIRVIDWGEGVPLLLELDRAKQRWSA